MKNLTKLFCDLLSAGSQLGDTTVPTEQIVNHLKYVAFHCLPEDCDADLEAIAEHVEDVRLAIRTANAERTKPLRIKRVTEFHNELTVHLDDFRELKFNSSDIVRF